MRNIAKVGIGLTAVGAAIGATSALDKETMETERAKDVETVRVDGVSIHGGPNVRSDAFIPNNPEESNVLARLDDDGQPIELHYEGDVYIYERHGDANGEWYGFDAKDFTASLIDAKCINGIAEATITGHEKYNDGVVWVNGKYVELNIVDAEGSDGNS